MHSVGDILYVVSNKKRQVLPAQVIEQINRKTLAGEQVQYQVLLAGSQTPVDLDSLATVGKIFSSLEEVHTNLSRQAESAIAQVIEDAIALAGEHFASSSAEPSPEIDSGDETVLADASETPLPKVKRVKVKLPDGTSANVSMPDV